MISPGELLRVPDTEVSFDERAHSASTKVKTAISWLERTRFLWRNENRTRVFQGVPAVRDLDAAKKKMERLDLPEHVRQRWLEIMCELQTADLREGIDADDLAHLPSVPVAEVPCRGGGGRPGPDGNTGDSSDAGRDDSGGSA